jgi:hypothetical protein
VVEVWETVTELKPKQRGGALAMRLGGKARTKAFKLGADVLSLEEILPDLGGGGRPAIAGQKSGVQEVLSLIRKHYGEDEQKDVLDKLLRFFSCRRTRDESHDDWRVRFDMVYEEAKGSGLSLNVTALTFLTMYWGGMTRPDMVSLLVPSEGKLPTTEPEQERLYAHVGRMKGFVGKSTTSEQAYFGKQRPHRRPKPNFDRGRGRDRSKERFKRRPSTPKGRRSFTPRRTFDRGRHFVLNSESENSEEEQSRDHDSTGDWYEDNGDGHDSDSSSMPELGERTDDSDGVRP